VALASRVAASPGGLDVQLIDPPAHAVVRPERAEHGQRPQAVRFEWKRVPGAVEYELVLRRGKDVLADGTFAAPGSPRRTKSTHVEVDLPAGAHAWEVNAIARDDVPLATSEVRTLVVCPGVLPVDVPRVGLRVERAEVLATGLCLVQGSAQGAPCTHVTLRLDDRPPFYARPGMASSWSAQFPATPPGMRRLLVTASDGVGLQQTSLTLEFPEPETSVPVEPPPGE
jgi:hypothetical protein